MAFLVAIIFMLVVLAYVGTGKQTAIDVATQDGQITAKQMLMYHSAASRMCPTTASCPVGAIDPTTPTNYLPTAYQSTGARDPLTNGTFQSLNTGTFIVTYLAKAPVGVPAAQFYSQVTAGLAKLTPIDMINYLGPYNFAKQEVPPRGASSWVNPTTGKIEYPTVAPAGIPVNLAQKYDQTAVIASMVAP